MPKIELDVLDAITRNPNNQGRDLSVVDEARRRLRAAGFEIPPLDSLVSSESDEKGRLLFIRRLSMAVCADRRTRGCWTSPAVGLRFSPLA